MAGQASDVELMLRLKSGDREALDVLVQRHRKPLINFIYRYTSNAAESEDLAHEAFIKVFQSASKYEPRAAFSTWLYRIATNVALNYIRDRKPHLTQSIENDPGEADESPRRELCDPARLIEDELMEKERVSKIRHALAGLPDNQRRAVILTKYQDLSIKESAEILKCSENAVKSLIFRAYSTLREKLVDVAGVRI